MTTPYLDSASFGPSLHHPTCAQASSPRRARLVIGSAVSLSLAAGLLIALPSTAQATPESNIGVGVWANYRYVQDNDRDDETFGDIADDALIIYADGNAGDEGKWTYSAELRIGPGSFTDPDNNDSGDNFLLHKAWIGWQAGENTTVRFGKSQVPFGWKTVNFWPGDILQAGYGDQMDVGVKLSSNSGPLSYDLAYYHADDWGETSTDTADDNGHWGSSTTYRKVQTVVGDVGFEFAPGQRVHLSAQAGSLQDLTDAAGEVDGDHTALALWYHGDFGPAYLKAEVMMMERELPANLRAANGLPDTIENTRVFAELGYRTGKWFFYLDGSLAMPDTTGNTADDVTAFAPGFSYNYGPGWIYVEYLTQDGFVDRNGMVGEGDFDALYLSADFYL